MLRKETSGSYQEFNDDDAEESPYQENPDDPEQETSESAVLPDEDTADSNLVPMAFNKACVKNVFTAMLVFIYIVLTAVAALLAYHAISDFMEKLQHPVMSVSYKEVEQFAPPGIALFPGKAELQSCQHHYHDHIPPRSSGEWLDGDDCHMEEVVYTSPYSNLSEKRALVLQGPTDVRRRELVFLQFSRNETDEDFSAISYMFFAQYSDMERSFDKAAFMRECEKKHATWTFSGGFRTWVKMSLVKTSGRNESVEFRQESSVVKYNDRRPEPEKTSELFFVVFQWRDPFIQQVKDIVTANPWNTIAILCGAFMALFKAADFAKLSIKWMIKIRKRHLKAKRCKEMNQIS